jgi:hypothetical protein
MLRTAAALVLVASALCLAAAPAGADVKWLCRPGLSDNPCSGDLTTRAYEPNGSSRVWHPKVAAHPRVDCFYVYPTTSNQPTLNATKSADPEIRSIAEYQAQRFSRHCRMFAPLYRQVTAVGVASITVSHDTAPYTVAYGDVREAWRNYLARYNHGRGFVLIGHSQGSRMLRKLIRDEIDSKPGLRRRLVSAIIPGANANVADFKHVPACGSSTKTGCLVSFSTFNETPPDDTRFGRTDTDPAKTALGLPYGPGLKVICTNPAALLGDGHSLRTLTPTEPFAPGIIAALLVRLYNGAPPTGDKPWLQPQDHYTGRCTAANHAHVLMTAPVDGARHLTPSPDDTWGLHLVDLNLPLGNLVALVHRQAKAWIRRQG